MASKSGENVCLEAFPDVYQEILDEAAAATEDLLPAKTKNRYEKEYEEFCNWKRSRKVEGFNEDILLCYVLGLSKNFAPSSLWTKMSMLKTCLKLRDNIDISRYGKVFTFLKRKSESYKPKKAKVLTSQQVTTFFMEAPDEVFLLEKVILLFGIYGACRRDELVKLSLDNIEDNGKFVVVTLQDTKNKSSRRFTITNDDTPFKGCDLYRQYAKLRPSGLQDHRFFVDFRKGKCTKQFVGVHKIGGVPKKIAEFLKLENPENFTGHTFRRSGATMLADNGGDLLTLKQFGGWRSSAVAEQYVEESVSKKIKISKQLFKSEAHKSTVDCTTNNEERKNHGQNCAVEFDFSRIENCKNLSADCTNNEEQKTREQDGAAVFNFSGIENCTFNFTNCSHSLNK